MPPEELFELNRIPITFWLAIESEDDMGPIIYSNSKVNSAY